MDKEEEVNRRIEMLKRKNELLMQRHKEVEADKKSAEKSGQSYSHGIVPSQYEPSRTSDHASSQRNPVHTRAHMDEPEEQDDRGSYRNRRNTRGRGTGNFYSRGNPRGTSNQFAPRGDSGHGSTSNRGSRRSQDYKAKRMENYRLMEEEMSQAPGENEDQMTSGVGVSRFLDDPRRKGDLEPEERWKSTRHKGSYGGLHFDNLKAGTRGRGRGYRGNRGGRGRGMSKLQMTAEYTGRERQDQEKWLAMREAADREIMARSKNAEGKWRREWDAEKNEPTETGRHHYDGHLERHPEPRRNYRGGGRGRRGSGKRRHGSHSQEAADKEIEPKTETTPEVLDNELAENATAGFPEESNEKEKSLHDESPAPDSTTAGKPQRVRNKLAKSPKHLIQQRAQTPSSKDGTEVWAQNSHHSDETGAEWKNGATRSVEQWLPSSEGNRNPAIDERMLEQQEDGATEYSQHLGRGWGSEKNIKATTAWVIDTEKAGAINSKPENPDELSEVGSSNPGNANDKGNAVPSRIKEVKEERTGARSASPRLNRKDLGLTVEIVKGGRRVKSQSEGESAQAPPNEELEKNDDTSKTKTQSAAPDAPISPLSPDFLKTPEGLQHVTDWAAEMDMQSPTYETRQLELQKALESQVVSGNVAGSEEVGSQPVSPDDSAANGKTSAEETGDNTGPEKAVNSPISYVESTGTSAEVLEDNCASSSQQMTTAHDVNKQSDESSAITSSDVSEKNTDSCELLSVDNVAKTDRESPDTAVQEGDSDHRAADSKYKDASEEIEDEFYECDEATDETKKLESVENVVEKEEVTLTQEAAVTDTLSAEDGDLSQIPQLPDDG